MDYIRGKSLTEWKGLSRTENIPLRTQQYIVCLEDTIANLKELQDDTN
jgi:hypothetical protein